MFGVFDMRGMWVIFCGLFICETVSAETFSAVGYATNSEFSVGNACGGGCTTYCANGFATNTQISNGRYVRNALIDAVW